VAITLLSKIKVEGIMFGEVKTENQDAHDSQAKAGNAVIKGIEESMKHGWNTQPHQDEIIFLLTMQKNKSQKKTGCASPHGMKHR
jgi:hypothetical protein